MMASGDIVWTFFDDGRGGTYCSGLVSRAGRKTFTVTWVSGRVQRFPQGHREIVKVPEHARPESEAYLRAAGVLKDAQGAHDA